METSTATLEAPAPPKTQQQMNEENRLKNIERRAVHAAREAERLACLAAQEVAVEAAKNKIEALLDQQQVWDRMQDRVERFGHRNEIPSYRK